MVSFGSRLNGTSNLAFICSGDDAEHCYCLLEQGDFELQVLTFFPRSRVWEIYISPRNAPWAYFKALIHV